MWFTKINKYYNDGLWTKEQVSVAVKMNKITEDEYKQITRDDYIA